MADGETVINNLDAERRGTVLKVSHCMFYKVVAVGFNTLRYDAERSRVSAGIKPSARIKRISLKPKISLLET